MIRKFKMTAVLIICLLLLSCWDAKELDELYLAYGIGIDVSQDHPERFLVTIAAPTIHPEAAEPKIEISSEGYSLRNAQDNIQNKAARRLTFTNTNMFILGEEAAKKGISKHIDSVLRDPEGRGTIRLVITEGRAIDLMNIHPPTFPLMSLFIFDILKQGHETTTIPRVTLRSFNNTLMTDGIDPVIPYIKYGNKPAELIINSIGLLKHDKMVGIIEGVDSSIFMLLRGEIQDGFFSLPYPQGEADSHPILSLRVMKGKSDIKTAIEDSKIIIHHSISLVTHISEYTADTPVLDEKVLSDMEKTANNHLELLCNKLIGKLQKEYGSDNIGYGRYIKVNHPEVFDAANWNKQFSTATIYIKPDIKIRMVGTKQ